MWQSPRGSAIPSSRSTGRGDSNGGVLPRNPATNAKFKKNSASHALTPHLGTASSASHARASPAFDETSRVRKFILITDQHSKILGYRILNSQLAFAIGIMQLIVCLWALTQHIYSMVVYKQVLYCDFDNATLTDGSQLLIGVDAIIFDIGLFHSLWGIHGCVAEHLDGGYGRFGWCIVHIIALIFCLPFTFVSRPKPAYLWPLLIQQSAYGIGLLILSLAALPRILPTFMGDLGNAPILPILFYLFGALMNYWLLYVFYHWYWHVESEYESATKLSHNRLSNEVHADPRRRPFHYPTQRLSQGNGFIPETQRSLLDSASTASTSAHKISNGMGATTRQVPYPARLTQNVSAATVARNHMAYNGYIPSENGYYGPMIASPMSQQSQRESLSSTVSARHYSKPPQRIPKPVYEPIPTDLLSPQYPSDDYPSDDSATAPILSHSSQYSSVSTQKYGPSEPSRSLTNYALSPYASMAQNRYAKFASTPVTFRKASTTPGGAPFIGNRIVPPLQPSGQKQPCSISSPSRPSSSSRHGTPLVGQMYSTAI